MAKKTVINTMAYLGAAIKEGQKVHGVERAPQIYREAGLFNALKQKFNVSKINDYGDTPAFDTKKFQNAKISQPYPIHNGQYMPHILRPVYQNVQKILNNQQNDFLLTVGGDHSIGSATIAGALSKYENLKVIWVDAHADMVNPSLGIRKDYNYHGMPLSHIMGLFKLNGFDYMKRLLPFRNLVLIGIRDIEENQFKAISDNKVKAFTMDHVDKYGIGNVVEQAINYLDPEGNSPFHISFDVDGLDPTNFSQTGTLFRYGLTPRQGCHIIRRVAHERKLVSMDLVETNVNINSDAPIRPKYREQHYYKDVSESVGVGIDLIESAFTKYLTL